MIDLNPRATFLILAESLLVGALLLGVLWLPILFGWPIW